MYQGTKYITRMYMGIEMYSTRNYCELDGIAFLPWQPWYN